MALVDLVSDLSKFRSTVKSVDNVTPETSKVKDSKSFGGLLPITEKLSQFSPNIQKPKESQLESKLTTTSLDDIVKKLQQDLTINSVSKYSPINVGQNSLTIGRVSVEDIISKFSNIQRNQIKSRLDKSDVIVLRSESGTNNLTSPIDVNTILAKTFDRRNSSPNINQPKQTPDKSATSPDIFVDKTDSSDNITNPNTIINKPSQFDDKSSQSPNVFSSMITPNKEETSPDIFSSMSVPDKSETSPEILSSSGIADKSSQSPNVYGGIQSSDRSGESPEVFSDINIGDKTKSSPDVFSNIRTPDKSLTSPNINIVNGDSSDNITNPNIEVFGKPLSFDRTSQSVLINKDIVSPINNIVNPDVKLDLNILTFNKAVQSPSIQTQISAQGYITNPDTKVFRIESGTYHLIDESRLNLDGIPFKFVTTTQIADRQSSLQRDNEKYNGLSVQLTDNSSYNIDVVQKTNPSGRNENPDQSILSMKGIQSVNFFSDQNAKGFVIKPQKGQSLYLQNSEYTWGGGRSAAETIGGFNSFVESIGSRLISKSSKYKWNGSKQNAPSVDYFDITKNNTTDGFTTFFGSLESKYINDSSNYQWKGNKGSAPQVNYFDDKNGAGFNKFVTLLESKYVKDSSNLTFKSKLPTPVNFITDINATGFINKTTPLVTSYKKDSSKFTFKGNSQTAPSVNYFTNGVNTGFTNFIQSGTTEFKIDSSRYSFKGSRLSAPSVNYFDDINSTGFTNFAESFKSNYDRNTSKFTWVGNREQAPEVDFFGIPGPNPKGIAGFTKLFVDKTLAKLTDQYSGLSFAGTTKRSDIKPVPFTKFFGFRPGELSGFMVGMSNKESSLYPILEPRLFADSTAATRFAIESSRAQNKRQRTTDDVSKYVPISLGGLPWFDGTNFGVATLGNQVPFIKTKVAEGFGSTYFRKYERLAKDSTDGNGYLTKWATTRRSPSPLDLQYSKFSLQKDSFNNDVVGSFRQPYIVRGIQRDGSVENQRWGFGVTFDDGLIRGGAVTHAERVAMDAYRLFQWTTSMKGILFNAKQVGLQLMNPNVDINPKKVESGFIGLSATQIYNPVLNPILINTVSARAGIHIARHGLIQVSSNFLNKYEDATIDRESNSKFIDPNYTRFKDLERPTVYGQQTSYNRLIGLMRELLPNSFQPVVTPANTGDAVKNAVANVALDIAKQLTGQSGIARLSSKFGGPQSFLGIGGTQISRPKHPYLTHYTTTPLLMLTGQQKEPQYQESAKRDTFFSATTMYKDLFDDTLRTIAYNLEKGPYELNDENLPRNKSKVKNSQPSTLDRIFNQNPFDAKYDNFNNRLKPVTAFDVQKNGSISDGVNPLNNDSANPIKQYRALSYDKLGLSRDRRRSKNGLTNVGDINDFREDLTKDNILNTFSTNPEISDYGNQNLEDKFGFGKHGKANVDRSNPSVSNIQYGRGINNLSVPKLKANSEFRGDRINIIDYKRGIFDLSKDSVYEKGDYNDNNLPGMDDLVEFYFTGVTLKGTQNSPAESIVFRSTFGSISDTHSAEWNPVDYIGRADPLYVYKGYTRQIQFDFTVHVTSRDEMKAVWRKLNHLASWTTPEYTKDGFIKGPIIRLNMGHLYRKMPGFISSLDYTFDNTENTWETAQLKNDMNLLGPDGRLSSPGVLQLPKTVKVNCSFTPIGMYRPEYNGIMYSLFDDSTGGKLENGLVPTANTKVNYFRSYELDDLGKEEPSDSLPNKKYYKIEPGTEDVIPEIVPENRETLV